MNSLVPSGIYRVDSDGNAIHPRMAIMVAARDARQAVRLAADEFMLFNPKVELCLSHHTVLSRRVDEVLAETFCIGVLEIQ